MTTPNWANENPPYGPPPYDMPGNPDGEPIYPTIYPPPVQALTVAYLTPRIAPVPVATRLPQPERTEDTISGFIRIEAAGGSLRGNDLVFDAGIILHSYAPNNQESQAEINMMRAVAHMGNAQGRYIVHPSLQRPWFVQYSRITALATKRADPLVNLTRFRAMVSWRVKGMLDPINEPRDSLQ